MAGEDGKRFSFIWSIENFFHSYHQNKDKLSSPDFIAESAGGSRWCVDIYPNGFNEENKEFVSCFLTRSKFDTVFAEEILVDFSLDAIGGNGEVLGHFQEKNKTFKKSESAGCFKLFKIEDVKNKIQTWKEDILKIRCSLASYTLIASEYIARTTIPIDFFSFDWKVNTNSSSQDHTFNINERKFTIYAISNNSIFIKLQERERPSESYLVTSNIILLDINGATTLQKRDVHFVPYGLRQLDAWEFLFLSREQLNNTEHIINDDGELSLVCQFHISSKTGVNEIVKGKTDLSAPLLALQDYHTLFSDEKHADIKLRTKNHVFSAHRCLLVARSPVFSAMFDQEMIESETGIIDVPDVDPDILKIFLEFLYTGTMKEFEYGNTLKLLIIADKYQVSSLSRLCSSYLVSQLSVANVCKLIYVADMINHKWMKTSAVIYLANRAAEVMGSPDWLEWMEKNHKLAAEIISYVATNFNFVPKKLDRKLGDWKKMHIETY